MSKLAIAANLAFAVVIAVAVALQSLNDRNLVIERAYSDAENLAWSLAEHTNQTLEALDYVLTSVADTLADNPGLRPEELSDLLRARRDASLTVYALHVLGPDGRVVASSSSNGPLPYDFSSYPGFIALRDGSVEGVFLGPPHQSSSSVSGEQWVVTLSRRIDHLDGGFGGTVAAGLALDHLTGVYESLNLGDDGLVTLFSDEGVITARYPAVQQYLGGNYSSSSLFAIVSEGGARGRLPSDEFIDGVARFAAWQRVPMTGTTVIVGLGRDAVLAAWQRRAVFSALIAVLSILLFAAVSTVVEIFSRRRYEWQQQQTRRLRKLARESEELARCPDEHTLLQRVTRVARELIGAHQVMTSLSLNDSHAQGVYAMELSDKYAQWRDYEEPSDGSGIYRLVCETNKPMCLTQSELQSHPAWRGFGEARERHPPMNGWLAAPIVSSDGRHLGLIQLSDKEAGDFDEDDLSELQQLAAITGVALDNLCARQALQDALSEANEAREEIETIFASISDGMMALDTDWRVVFMNGEAERLLQRSRDKLIGKHVWDEFPEARGASFEEHYRVAREERRPVNFTSWFEPLQTWFEVRAFPHDKGLTVYFHDVTLRREAEEHLRQAQKMEAVGQLTGGIAHDFNNLLTVILGSTEAMLDDGGQLPGAVRAQLRTVYKAGERAAALTHRLLAFARKQPLEPRPINANELLMEFEEILRRTLGADIDIELVRGCGLWAAVADPNELQNAILNLAINARDAMPGGGRLTIETANAAVDGEYASQHDLQPGQYVMIAVSDTGTGMSPEIAARVFEPFFTTKETGKGSGLGLSMVYGFARQSKGHVTIYSEPGAGTTVRVYLPRVTGNVVSTRSDRGRRAPFDDGLHHILLVEDDDLVREFATTCLHSLGYRVTPCGEGAVALEHLESGARFDLLLTDVVLPGGMTGRQVADRAQRLQPDLPVLYMSGYTENAIVHHGRLDAGVLLLSKPFRRAELDARVRQALAGRDA